MYRLFSRESPSSRSASFSVQITQLRSYNIVLRRMDTSVQLNPNDLFSASGLVVVLTGGGSGTITMLSATDIPNQGKYS